MSAAIESLNFFIIVIYDLWPTYSFLHLFHDCPFGNGGADHFTDLLNDLLNTCRYYKYWQNMCLSWPKIQISVQTDWLWSTGRGGVNYKVSFMDLRLKTNTLSLVFGVPKDTDIFSVEFWEPRSQYSKTCLKNRQNKGLKDRW